MVYATLTALLLAQLSGQEVHASSLQGSRKLATVKVEDCGGLDLPACGLDALAGREFECDDGLAKDEAGLCVPYGPPSGPDCGNDGQPVCSGLDMRSREFECDYGFVGEAGICIPYVGGDAAAAVGGYGDAAEAPVEEFAYAPESVEYEPVVAGEYEPVAYAPESVEYEPVVAGEYEPAIAGENEVEAYDVDEVTDAPLSVEYEPVVAVGGYGDATEAPVEEVAYAPESVEYEPIAGEYEEYEPVGFEPVAGEYEPVFEEAAPAPSFLPEEEPVPYAPTDPLAEEYDVPEEEYEPAFVPESGPLGDCGTLDLPACAGDALIEGKMECDYGLSKDEAGLCVPYGAPSGPDCGNDGQVVCAGEDMSDREFECDYGFVGEAGICIPYVGDGALGGYGDSAQAPLEEYATIEEYAPEEYAPEEYATIEEYAPEEYATIEEYAPEEYAPEEFEPMPVEDVVTDEFEPVPADTVPEPASPDFTPLPETKPAPASVPPPAPAAVPPPTTPKPSQGGMEFHGEMTYYGGAGSGGACTQTWVPPGFMTVALNGPQYDAQNECGTCVYACWTNEETNDGERCIEAIIDNKCPECAHGDLDLGESGSGRWPVDWKKIPCPTKGKPKFVKQGSNASYAKVKAEGGPSSVTGMTCNGMQGKGTPDSYYEFLDTGKQNLDQGMDCTVKFSNGETMSSKGV